jgi:hypothetical protein
LLLFGGGYLFSGFDSTKYILGVQIVGCAAWLAFSPQDDDTNITLCRLYAKDAATILIIGAK